MFELLSQYGVYDLQAGLREREPVVYRDNGNRATNGSALLARLEKLAPLLGITRIANISQMVPNSFPVYQSTRPRIHSHYSFGQNTGAQGKGTTDRQAKLSCLMESVESYSAEPRSPRLVRGSYARLKHHVAVSPPKAFLRGDRVPSPSDDKALMWTPALHVQSNQEVLVPAETVYFPFPTASYGVTAMFPCSTNGLASGATYLEATIHALYELIERMYIGLAERRRVRVEAIFESDYTGFDFKALREQETELELQMYAFEVPGIRNVPMVACTLVGDDLVCFGWGCCGQIDTAISRALSEVLQSYALCVSGNREDLDDDGPGSRHSISAFKQPERRTLRLDRWRRRTKEFTQADLQSEFRAILRWLSALGFDDVYIANLTRHGIDIPVVKVIVPGLPMKRQLTMFSEGPGLSVEKSLRREYCA